MKTNLSLQALLLNARLICLVKFQAVEKSWGKGNAEVKKLHEGYQTLFAHLSNPNFWKKEIPFAAGDTAKLILQLDGADPAKQSAYLTKGKALLTHLQDDLFKASLADISAVSTSTWNLKMLNALREVLQEVDARKVFFKSKGKDLDKNAEFRAMEVHQNEVVGTYRSLLISNAVEATETKVNNIKKRKTMMSKAEELNLFLTIFKKWTAYINKQITATTLVPLFEGKPSNKNNKALIALSRTLVKIDQRMATLAEKGKDFSQDVDFPALHAEQKKLVTAYHKALFSNAIESKDSDVNKIVKIGDAIVTIKEVNTLKGKYTAINDLMRSVTTTA